MINAQRIPVLAGVIAGLVGSVLGIGALATARQIRSHYVGVGLAAGLQSRRVVRQMPRITSTRS
jgi:hypothetical protein